MSEQEQIKQDVRRFYDAVGWEEVSEGVYQNAHYEDLRPVSSEYIHNCHLRLKTHLNPVGKFLLDAGSGPVQYPEYLEYSKGYEKRVCADISVTALREARKRIGEHGLFVVCDVSKLPFKENAFDGLVSLHTIHHLPQQDHVPAYRQFHRVMAKGAKGVVVNGWHRPLLVRILEFPFKFRGELYKFYRRIKSGDDLPDKFKRNTGTHVRKYNARWLTQQLSSFMQIQIVVWRSVSVAVLRHYIHPESNGEKKLKRLYTLEERFPHFLGRIGAYPMVVLKKD